MVTSIDLGGFGTQNGRNVLSGSASGLDTETLINALADAKRLPAVQLEERLESNASLSTAYSDLDRILTTFQDAANFLRNPPGVGNEDENMFEYRGGSVSSSDGLAGSNYLTITAEPGASITSYDITVDQLATQNVKVTETFTLADADTQAVDGGGPFSAGTFTFGPNSTSVEFETGDTLNQLVAKFRAVEDQSGVEVTLIQVNDGEYRLSFKTTETGSDQNYSLGVPEPPSFLSTDAVFHLDANDIDGDGSYSDNPGADQVVPTPTDISGTTGINAQNGGATLDVDGLNGIASFDFSGGNVGYRPNDNALINNGGPYDQKTIAVAFRTGADVSGTQAIYEQGNTTTSFGLFIAPDAGNGNAPTLFGTISNYDGSWPGNETKTVNLGVVTTDTDFTVVLEFDASANPGSNDPSNTLTGFVNGVQIDQIDSVAQLSSTGGNIGVGYNDGGSRLPDGTAEGGDGEYFDGRISEVILTNTVLSNNEMTELEDYFDQKYLTAINDPAVLGSVGFAINENAVDAQMTLDGTTITRQSNSFSDVIDDLTFNLVSETSVGEDLELRVTPDTELVKSAIFNFVDSYNEFRIFQAEQSQLNDDGTLAEDSLLATSSTLRSVSSRISSEMSGIIDGITSGDPDRLADVGLSFEDFPGDAETPFTRNILTVDEAALDSVLASDFSAIRKVFEFDFSSDDPDLTVFSRTNALSVSDVDLNIDVTNTTFEATYDNGSGPITIAMDAEELAGGGGYILTGQDGTVLEGLTLIYSSTDDATVNLTLTQGIGDRIYNAMDEVLDSTDGLLAVELESIAGENERLQSEIDRIDQIVADYRDRLLAQFSALEAAISQANTILQSLAANSAARNNA